MECFLCICLYHETQCLTAEVGERTGSQKKQEGIEEEVETGGEILQKPGGGGEDKQTALIEQYDID